MGEPTRRKTRRPPRSSLIPPRAAACTKSIRRAYHKSALRLHPDKNPGDENSKEKFQQLQNVMAVLGDPEKRELYDQTGSIDAADIDGDAVKSLYNFLRTLFKQVTEEDIDVFSASYRGFQDCTASESSCAFEARLLINTNTSFSTCSCFLTDVH